MHFSPGNSINGFYGFYAFSTALPLPGTPGAQGRQGSGRSGVGLGSRFGKGGVRPVWSVRESRVGWSLKDLSPTYGVGASELASEEAVHGVVVMDGDDGWSGHLEGDGGSGVRAGALSDCPLQPHRHH